MPANHRVPHTEEAKAKMRAARLGKPAPWKRRPTTIVGGVVHYRCGRCREFFLKEQFPKKKGTILGIGSDCRKCHSAIAIASRDPETTRANKVRSEALRRARAAGASGYVAPADWDLVLSILGTKCLRCGSGDRPTQDHVVPLSRGGAHCATNLQPLCRPCNEKKQARTQDYRTEAQREEILVTFRRVEEA